jgi:hypothetical protein
MCDCTSCSYTDSFADKGFAEWPRGEPKGKARSDAEYRGHVAHSWAGVSKRVQFTLGQAPQFNIPWLVHPVTPLPAWIRQAVADKPRTGGNVFPGPDVKMPKPKAPSLLSYARELRAQAKRDKTTLRRAA